MDLDTCFGSFLLFFLLECFKRIHSMSVYVDSGKFSQIRSIIVCFKLERIIQLCEQQHQQQQRCSSFKSNMTVIISTRHFLLQTAIIDFRKSQMAERNEAFLWVFEIAKWLNWSKNGTQRKIRFLWAKNLSFHIAIIWRLRIYCILMRKIFIHCK